MWLKIKNFIFDLLFPAQCLGCQKEGTYLCEDCQSILGILESHKTYSTKNLKDLYFSLPYQNPLVKNLIQKFKYQPYIKELSKSLANLIISHFQCLENPPEFIQSHFQCLENPPEFIQSHFQCLENPPEFIQSHFKLIEKPLIDFAGFILIPVPLSKKRLKERGFNQTEEIGKELSKLLKIPLISDCLIKVKETLPQVELSDEEREENIKDAFSCQNQNKIQGRKILLIDDVYTTGSTMEECGRVLKDAGVREIIGIVTARG